MKLNRYKRELSAAVAYALLLALVAVVAPSFFSVANLRDLALNNAPALIIATGMTMVILAGQIDISVGSQFAVASVAAGWLAKSGVPVPMLLLCALLIGAAMGAVNGVLVGYLRLPSIIVTLAMLVAWRDALRWITEGAWVQGLPADFQWFGLGQNVGQWLIVGVALAVLVSFIWLLGNLSAGRAIYAVGSDSEAARLAGIEPPRVVFGVFVLMGALTGLAALLNAARFSVVPSNAGVGSGVESDCCSRGGRDGHHWRARHARRHADRRDDAGHHRHGSDLLRNKSILGTQHSRRDHTGSADFRRRARTLRTIADFEFQTAN